MPNNKDDNDEVEPGRSGFPFFKVSLVLMVLGWLAATELLDFSAGTQNPFVGFLTVLLIPVIGVVFLIGIISGLISAVTWLVRTPKKTDHLRRLLTNKRTHYVIGIVIVLGIGVMLIPERKHGLVIEWDDNGQKKSEAIYVRGHKRSETSYVNEQQSVVTEWPSGSENKDSEKRYVDGQLTRSTRFYDNGKTSSEKRYVNGQLTRSIGFWSNGKTSSEVSYVDGQIDGPSINYDENGHPSSEDVYVTGQLTESAEYTHYDNGQMKTSLRKRFNLETPELTSGYEFVQQSWYESGQKRFEFAIQMIESWIGGTYRATGGTGLSTSWYENGYKEAEYHIVKGRRNGIATTWYDNGQKKAEANYINGKQVGLETAWKRDYTEAEIQARRLVPRNTRNLNVPSDGLLGYFQFESNSEDSVYDRELTSTDTRFFDERIKGNYAANFKGWGYYTAESSPFQLKESLTIALWVKFVEVPERWAYGNLISNSTKGAELPPDRKFWSGYWIDVVPNLSASNPRHAQIMHPRFFAETNIGDSPEERRNELTADRPLEIGEWSHIAVVFDGVQKAIYVNGELSGTQYAAPNARKTEITYASASEFLIGSWEQGEFSGSLDDILIYNRPLSQDEIRNIYLDTKQ